MVKIVGVLVYIYTLISFAIVIYAVVNNLVENFKRNFTKRGEDK